MCANVDMYIFNRVVLSYGMGKILGISLTETSNAQYITSVEQ